METVWRMAGDKGITSDGGIACVSKGGGKGGVLKETTINGISRCVEGDRAYIAQTIYPINEAISREILQLSL